MKKFALKKFVLISLLLFASACARQPMVPSAPDTAIVQDQRWQKFTELSTAAPATPYRLQLSLRFGTEGDTRRVTALFWGNSQRQLRLDVMAGVGAVVAKILEDGQHFLVYAPRENKGYFYQGASKPLLQVGVPVPFGLAHLAGLLNGHYSEVFGQEATGRQEISRGLVRYSLGGSLELNDQGQPVFWREKQDGKGWSMEITYDESPLPLPRRLNLSHHNGQKAIILVKEREKPATPFDAEQMGLTLPPDAPLLPLAKFKKS